MGSIDKGGDLSRSPYVGGKQMSSSLKERLKRCARNRTSPMMSPIPSQIKATPPANKSIPVTTYSSPCQLTPCPVSFKTPIENVGNIDDELKSKIQDLCSKIEKCEDRQELLKLYSNLKHQVLEKEEKLRKLKLVQQYHSKHNPEDLDKLIQKWLTGAQEALRKLHEIIPEPKGDMRILVLNLQIEPSLVKYNHDNDTFS